jgi:hypothetical protein
MKGDYDSSASLEVYPVAALASQQLKSGLEQ